MREYVTMKRGAVSRLECGGGGPAWSSDANMCIPLPYDGHLISLPLPLPPSSLSLLCHCVIVSVVVMAPIISPASPQARLSYLGISVYLRKQRIPLPSCTPSRSSSSGGGGTYRRSDFTNQPFTGIYEPGGPTEVYQRLIVNKHRVLY